MNSLATGRLHILFSYLAILAGLLASSGCTGMLPPSLSTPLPPEFIPTAAAMTLEAQGADPPTPTIKPAPGLATATANQEPTARSTFTPTAAETSMTETIAPSNVPEMIPTATPTEKAEPPAPPPAIPVSDPSQGTPTFTPAPPIPEARIQILRLGELSKVLSPLDVSLRLTCGDAKLVRIELHGEDGRLLARYVREYQKAGWDSTRIAISLDFEISAAAELGRLVINAEDSYGRIIESNSMNLLLLSQGMTELNPSNGLQQQIIIQDPGEMALIQNGRLIVSGRAHPQFDRPLRVMLIAEDGRVLGQRLAGVNIPVPGDYGTFIAEVPYEVDEITPALLVVYEEGYPISETTYLTSLNVILAP